MLSLLPERNARCAIISKNLKNATGIFVAGEVDVMCRDLFDCITTCATTATDRALIVDFSACTYINSSGLAVLIRSHNHARRRIVVIASRTKCVNRIFAICNLGRCFTIVADVSQALEAIAA